MKGGPMNDEMITQPLVTEWLWIKKYEQLKLETKVFKGINFGIYISN